MRKRIDPNPVSPDYYFISDIMAMLKVGRQKVYDLIAQGKLKRVSIGSSVRVTAESYEAFKAEIEGRHAA